MLQEGTAMTAEGQINGAAELLNSTRAQIDATREHSRDLREATLQTIDAISHSKDCMKQSDHAVRRWWFRPETCR